MLLKNLFETPIEDFNLVGDWNKNSSFHTPQDRKLLSNPKAQAKIIHKWQKTIVPFNMYFVNAPEVNHSNLREVGKVSYEWLQENMPKTLSQLKLRDDAVNVIFTNNRGAEREPMTAWVIAHRFGHVIRMMSSWTEIQRLIENKLNLILRDVYGKKAPHPYGRWEERADFGKITAQLCQHIGTMKSARDHNLRNEYEFNYELLAQYMLTGKIKFNPLPANFGYGKMAWGRSTNTAIANKANIEHANEILAQLSDDLTERFANLLHDCVGGIFVM